MATNVIGSISHQIESLCDLVPNARRTNVDLQNLLGYLKQYPKECVPFKGKILNHLNLHAHVNPRVNLRLVACCYSRTSLLFRKSVNKSEGPLGTWKEALRCELIKLEDNLDELYQLVGVTSNRVIGHKDKDEPQAEEVRIGQEINSRELMSRSPLDGADFKSIIDEYISKINISAHFVCALISAQTEFDMPIPVQILLRLAVKLCLLRLKDFRKKPNGLVRQHIYSKTPLLLDVALLIFETLILVVGTNIIPSMPFFNQSVLRMLEWTRTSNLMDHDPGDYHSVRAKLFKLISFTLDRLALKINLEPQSLKCLLEQELVENLENSQPNVNDNEDQQEHISMAMQCLESLLVVYSKFLDEPLERRIKTHVIHKCIEIYRNFESTTTSENYRYQLLSVLVVVANQPYSTSTTEISQHIFELASKSEINTKIRALAYRATQMGLAHRPTLVSHHDVYNIYNRPMLIDGEQQNGNQVLPSTIPSISQGDPITTSSMDQDPPMDQNDPEVDSYLNLFVDKLAE